MQLNSLSPSAGSTKTGKRVGRGIGSGSGKTCGRGHNGQKSRSGGTLRPGFEGGQMPLHMRLPKFGFSSRVGRISAEVRTAELNKVDAEVIDVAALRKANLITAGTLRVKVMLSGDVTRAVTLKGIGVTKGARAAIEAAGGKILEEEAPAKAKLVKKEARVDSAKAETDTAKAKTDTAKAETETAKAKTDTAKAKTETAKAKAETDTAIEEKTDTAKAETDTAEAKADPVAKAEDGESAPETEEKPADENGTEE